KADAYTLRLPADLSAPVAFEEGGQSVALALRGAHGRGVAEGRTDRFANALPQTDVAYTATSVGAREPLTLASPSAPQSFTYIPSGSPDTFVGGDPLLRVGSDGTQSIRGLLNFQLDTALPSGSVVDNAQLVLYLESESSTAPASVSVYGVTDPWNDATWNQY